MQEAAWVEKESITTLVALVWGTQKQAVFATLLLLVVLYFVTSTAAWYGWLAVHCFVFALRILFFYELRNIRKQSTDAQVHALYYKHIYVIALIGLSWGATLYVLDHDRLEVYEALSISFIYIYGTASSAYLSHHLRSLYYFLAGFFVGLLGALITRLVFTAEVTHTVANIALIVVSILLCQILLRFGQQLNQTHVKALKHEFRNNYLLKTVSEERDKVTVERNNAIEAIAAKNRLIASTAHDMRQPVLALDMYANWLVEEPELSQTITPKIASATREVISQFDALFDLAQLNQNKSRVNLIDVDLMALMQELCDQHEVMAKSKGLVLRSHLIAATIKTDPLLLKRLVSNVIANAIKYSHQGGILVGIRNYPRGLSIEVWDTGMGIPDHEQNLVFEAFYKSKANDGTSDGFGLGLSIVQQLGIILGHSLRLKSRVQRGTLVAIDLNTSLPQASSKPVTGDDALD